MKIIKFFFNNLLFFFIIFILVFIPLYPKIPIFNVNHTWVYIRVEDFIMVLIFGTYALYLLFKKATLKTPLTLPILVFWLVGLVSTINAILFIFPHLAGVFPQLALFHYARKIEYVGLFFIAYNSIKNKKQAPYIIWALFITLVAVVLYGLGQKYLGFPAFLTGNEEFAKGVPLRLSAAARIPSTFAGHYDLAAWLVLIIPIMGSMVFAYKNWFLKLLFIFSTFWALILLLMTASRVSYMVYLVVIVFLLILQKQKKFIIPVVIASLLLLSAFQGIASRFGSTISQVDLVVDARTGKAVGIAKDGTDGKKIVIEDKQATGENLPQGTGYINLPGTDTNNTSTQVTFRRTKMLAGKESTDVTSVEGDFVIKKALAYDVSFTTRFQGTWPRAINAFKRNILLGSGYSSIDLATDSNYLRILGEVGLLGFMSFGLIFIFYGIYVAKTIKHTESKLVKGLILGVSAGILGVALNAVLIDVFEASKVAFVFWPLMGVSVGLLHLSQKQPLNYKKEIIRVFTSIWAVSIYFLIATFMIFSRMLSDYFVADDFVWLRFVGDCKKVLYQSGIERCQPFAQTVLSYFTDSQNFFYRPGNKLYFYFMYSVFWLNNAAYHLMSLLLHFGVVVLIYLISEKILKSKIFGLFAAILFLVLSVHSETIFWISSTQHLIVAFTMMLSLYLYQLGRERRNFILLGLSFLSAFSGMFFHEYAIATPLIIIAYEVIFNFNKVSYKEFKKHLFAFSYLLQIPVYVILRNFAHSLWSAGDYAINLQKLPLNIVGNLIGYIGLTIFGNDFLSYQAQIRAFGKANLPISVVVIVVCVLSIVIALFYARKIKGNGKKVVAFSLLFFVISLLPFLGLGGVTIRYDYISSFGLILLFVFVLKMIYTALSKWNRYVSYALITGIVALVAFYNYNQLVKAHNDWKRAGETTQNLLVGLNNYYSPHNKVPGDPVFYFVDVPASYGQAWVFKVGLPDALWFTFQNENLTVHTASNLELALDESESSGSARVFQFNKDGVAEEVTRTKIVVPKK